MIQRMVNPDGKDVPQMMNHCTACNDRYMMFSLFLSLKSKIIVFIPTPSIPNFVIES